MLDILLPISFKDRELAAACIDHIEASTRFPHNLLVLCNGGSDKDWDELRVYMNGITSSWAMLHEYPEVSDSKFLMETLPRCKSPMVAIIHPEVLLEDQQWVAKVQQVYDRDPAFGIAFGQPNTRSKTQPPTKCDRRGLLGRDPHLLVAKTKWIQNLQGLEALTFEICGLYEAHDQGLSVWFVPSISFKLQSNE